MLFAGNQDTDLFAGNQDTDPSEALPLLPPAPVCCPPPIPFLHLVDSSYFVAH